MDQLSAWVQAAIRSTVPSVVALVFSWLVARGLVGPDVAEELGPEATLVAVALVIALWNTLARWLEPRLPSWVTTAMGLVGTAPSYVDTTATEKRPARSGQAAG